MKKIFFIIFSVLLTNPLSSQVIFNHKIDSVLNLVSVHSVSRINKELSGDTVVTIGGVPQILYSRYWPTTGNVKASQYIYEKLQNYGYNAKYQVNNSTCVNVYTEKTGSKFPGRKYIISAHYDDITNPFPSLYDTIHGSDDNASGVCCVLEAARLLANYNCDYTIVFALFDEEEILTYLGSKAFADSAYFRGDTILGVINMDMVAYNINNDSLLFLYTNINSMNLTDDLANCLQIYNLNLNIFKYITESQGSDQINFWARNYKAISGQEYHFNPNYHKKEEKFNNINLPYFIRCVKASLAVLLTWATDYHIVFAHNRILSSLDTSARIATAIIKIPSVLGTIGTSGNAPRLYYKTDNGQFNYVNAFYINGDQFNFIIPGNTAGKKISYYLALQDSAASFVFTLPGGGSGVNPPGTISPPSIYTYDILSAGNFCSNNLRPINDFQTTTDTI